MPRTRKPTTAVPTTKKSAKDKIKDLINQGVDIIFGNPDDDAPVVVHGRNLRGESE